MASSILKEHYKNMDNKKIVLVGGCFDILHFGHINFLQKQKNKEII